MWVGCAAYKGTKFHGGGCRAHVSVWDGRRVLPVRRADAPRGAPREQEISVAGPKTARRSGHDGDAAVAARGGHTTLHGYGGSARASRPLSPHTRENGGRTWARV